MYNGQLDGKLKTCESKLKSMIDEYKQNNGFDKEDKVYSTEHTARRSEQTDDFLFSIINAHNQIEGAIVAPNAYKQRISLGEALRYLNEVETEAESGSYFGEWRYVVEELIKCREFLKERENEEDRGRSPPQQDSSQQNEYEGIVNTLRKKLGF